MRQTDNYLVQKKVTEILHRKKFTIGQKWDPIFDRIKTFQISVCVC